jgi:hypothetical protein
MFPAIFLGRQSCVLAEGFNKVVAVRISCLLGDFVIVQPGGFEHSPGFLDAAVRQVLFDGLSGDGFVEAAKIRCRNIDMFCDVVQGQ